MDFRRTLACVFVGIVCILAGFVAGTPDRNISCKYAHPANEAAIAFAAKGENNTSNDAEHSNCDPPPWYATFKRADGMLVLVGIATFFVIGWQAIETKLSVKAAEKNMEVFISKERARLLVDLEDLDLVPHQGIYEIRLKVSIVGATPAFIVDTKCAAYIVSEEWVADKETADRAMLSLYSMPSTISANSPPIEEFAILSLASDEGSEALIAEVNAHRLFAGIRGSIIYTDVFDRERRTPFRYVWRPSLINGISGKWMKCGSPEENEAT